MYTYDIDPQAMFEDRAQQFEKFGIPCDDTARARAAVTDMWADAPGGWVYEWSKLAQDYADSGDHATAATAYGFAKFPCLNSPARVPAMDRQLEQYELAAKDFPVHFRTPHDRDSLPWRNNCRADSPVLDRWALRMPPRSDGRWRRRHLQDGFPSVVSGVHDERRGDHIGFRQPVHRRVPRRAR
jgi:hypothetical protein